MLYPKIANKIIEWGIIFLIVFTPLAFGTVHPWAYTLMELTICFLVIIWILKLIIINIKRTSTNCWTPIAPASCFRKKAQGQGMGAGIIPNRTLTGWQASPRSAAYRFSSSLSNIGSVKNPLNIPILLFVGLILFQLAPLPPGVLKFISPNTYQLYQTTSPEWQTSPTVAQAESRIQNPESRIQKLESRISDWKSISTYPHATKAELYKILAYIGTFFLIINYSPSTRSTQPVTRGLPRKEERLYWGHRLQIKTFITRLVIVLIVVGCFESIYGLLECLSGHQHIFFRKKIKSLEYVTGTYINRNHFAGYMAIVICMSFGYLTYLLTKVPSSNVSTWRQKLSQIINLIGAKSGLLFFLILIMSSALIMSGSRMGICSFITAIILMSIMISSKAPTQRGRISIKKITFILLPVCLMSIWIGLNPVIKGFSQIPEAVKAEYRRIPIWKDTYNLIKDYPTLGTGLGTYEYAFPKYKTIRAQFLYDHAHNDYLELMSDTGFTGFFIVIAGAAYYLFMVIRLWFQRRNRFVRCITIGCLGGIAYIILHSLTDFNLHIPANALHLSIITGIMHKTLTQL